MNEQYDEKAFAALGYAAGRAFGAMLDAFMRGFVDHQREQEVSQGVELVHQEPEDVFKTRISDCRGCWCD